MIHDPDLLDSLSTFEGESFSGTVFRATRASMDPLAPSVRGGRWPLPDECSILYTSLTKDAALAEIAYYWSQLDPLPSKPVLLSELEVSIKKTLRILHIDFERLGIDQSEDDHQNYQRCQEVGAAANFLGFDGLIAPSA